MRKTLNFQQGTALKAYMALGQVHSGGVCASLSMYYLLAGKEDRNFSTWIGNIGNKSKVVNVHSRKKNPDDYMDIIYGLMRNKFEWLGSYQGRVHEIFKMMTHTGKGASFRWILFTSPGPGNIFFPQVSHAVAVDASGDRIKFFDPNHGEWEFDSLREFYPWIGGFFRTHYHARFYDGTIEVQYLD